MKRTLALILCMAILSAFGLFAQQTRTLELKGSQGNLYALFQRPDMSDKMPLVILCHGFGGDCQSGLLQDIANDLYQDGIATLRFDFNGHGASEGDFIDMTIPNELEDARRMYAYAQQLPHVSSISAVGHSQGGVIVGMLAGELGADKLKTIVLMSAAPELKQDTARGELFGVKFDPTNPPEFITLANGLQVGRAYLLTTQHLPIYEISHKYTGPVLVLHSKDDQLVPYRYGEEYSRVFTNATLKLVDGFDHNYTQDTPAADKIVADFLEHQLVPIQ